MWLKQQSDCRGQTYWKYIVWGGGQRETRSCEISLQFIDAQRCVGGLNVFVIRELCANRLLIPLRSISHVLNRQ